MKKTNYDQSYSATQIKEMLCDYLKKPSLPNDEIKEEYSFAHDLGLDSLDKIEAIIWSENKFGIIITDDEEEAIKTVGMWIQLVTQKVEASHRLI